MAYTTFKLPSGATVSVQSRHEGVPAVGASEASAADDRVSATWSDGLKMVSELAQETVDQLRAATKAAKEVSVEFGVNISGKTGIIIVEGTVAANLKVVLKW